MVIPLNLVQCSLKPMLFSLKGEETLRLASGLSRQEELVFGNTIQTRISLYVLFRTCQGKAEKTSKATVN